MMFSELRNRIQILKPQILSVEGNRVLGQVVQEQGFLSFTDIPDLFPEYRGVKRGKKG